VLNTYLYYIYMFIYIMYIIRILNSTTDTWSRAWCSHRSMSCTSCSTQCDGFKLFCRVGRARETSGVSDGAGQNSELLARLVSVRRVDALLHGGWQLALQSVRWAPGPGRSSSARRAGMGHGQSVNRSARIPAAVLIHASHCKGSDSFGQRSGTGHVSRYHFHARAHTHTYSCTHARAHKHVCSCMHVHWHTHTHQN
jgi:hypothetical protein